MDEDLAVDDVRPRQDDEAPRRLLDVQRGLGGSGRLVIGELADDGDIVGQDVQLGHDQAGRIAGSGQEDDVVEDEERVGKVHEVGDPPEPAEGQHPRDPQLAADQLEVGLATGSFVRARAFVTPARARPIEGRRRVAPLAHGNALHRSGRPRDRNPDLQSARSLDAVHLLRRY